MDIGSELRVIEVTEEKLVAPEVATVEPPHATDPRTGETAQEADQTEAPSG